MIDQEEGSERKSDWSPGKFEKKAQKLRASLHSAVVGEVASFGIHTQPHNASAALPTAALPELLSFGQKPCLD